MSMWLQVAVDRYHILLDGTHVLEIRQSTNQADSLHHHRLWRGQTLPTLLLRHLLGMDARAGQAFCEIIYQPPALARPVMILCDQVLSLLRLEESQFQTMPPLSDELRHFFKALYPDPKSGVIFLRWCDEALAEAGEGESRALLPCPTPITT